MKLNQLGSNQTEIRLNDDVTVFFSYETPVACISNGKFYRTEYKWSVTTSKHINKWLNGAKAELRDQTFFNTLVGAYKGE